jgi:hypothetical protein
MITNNLLRRRKIDYEKDGETSFNREVNLQISLRRSFERAPFIRCSFFIYDIGCDKILIYEQQGIRSKRALNESILKRIVIAILIVFGYDRETDFKFYLTRRIG